MLYGISGILGNYCGVYLNPLQSAYTIQHGWEVWRGLYLPPLYDIPNKIRLVWNFHNSEESQRLGYYNTTAIGSPLLYMEEDKSPVADNNNLIVFPSHSCVSGKIVNPVVANLKLVQSLNNIRDNFDRIDICLYCFEYENKAIRDSIMKAGYNILTLGHRGNLDFLYKFRETIKRYKYFLSNVAGSSFMFAVYYGLICYLYGEKFQYNIPDDGITEWTKKEYPFFSWENRDNEPHIITGQKELGLSYKKEPRELARLLKEAEKEGIK